MMTAYIPEEILDKIEKLTAEKNYDEAISCVNEILSRDPKNEQALLLITDILYRQGNMDGADKAVSFLNSTKKNDPLGLYVKGLLEMERNNRKDARDYLKKAMDLTEGDNHEIVRCYGLSEYWYGNREKGREILKKAYKQDSLDAEVIYNIVQLAILEDDYEESGEMIKFYRDHHSDIKVVDKTIERYDKKFALFERFINGKVKFKIEK